jgi:hypothetical protein
MSAERSGETGQGAQRYAIRVGGDPTRPPSDHLYLAYRVIQRENEVLATASLRDAAVFDEPGARARLELVRSLLSSQGGIPEETWAIGIELRVHDGRPKFVLGSSSGGG